MISREAFMNHNESDGTQDAAGTPVLTNARLDIFGDEEILNLPLGPPTTGRQVVRFLSLGKTGSFLMTECAVKELLGIGPENPISQFTQSVDDFFAQGRLHRRDQQSCQGTRASQGIVTEVSFTPHRAGFRLNC